MTRPRPEKCEICRSFPATTGVGFPADPRAIPGLPDHLRGECVWVCDSPECDLTAQKRAVIAAAKYGVTLTKIWRHHAFGGAANQQKGN